MPVPIHIQMKEGFLNILLWGEIEGSDDFRGFLWEGVKYEKIELDDPSLIVCILY